MKIGRAELAKLLDDARNAVDQRHWNRCDQSACNKCEADSAKLQEIADALTRGELLELTP